MLTPVPPTDCMRARESASAQLDDELTQLEAAWLDAHLRECGECLAWTREAALVAARLRDAELELPEAPVRVPGRGARRQVVRVAGAAVAAAAVLGGTAVSLQHSFAARTRANAGARVDLAALNRDTREQHVLALLHSVPGGIFGRPITV